MPDASAGVSRWWVVPLRLFLGVLWLSHGADKLDPTYGGFRGIVRVMAEGTADHPQGNPIEPFRQFLTEIVLPNWQVFGALVTAGELLIGLTLLLGLITRLSAFFGALMMVIYWLGRGYLEWPFVYPTLILSHIILVWTAAGRTLGFDRRLHDRSPKWFLW